MKSKYEIFLAGLVATTLGVVIYIINSEGLGGSIGPLGWMLLGAVVYMEVMQMFYDEQVTMSLSDPVLILAVYTQPFWFVILLVLVCSVAGKLFQTYYYHERERVFDKRLAFNAAQFALIVSLVHLLFSDVRILEPRGLFYWMIASAFYILANMGLTGLMLSLYQEKNGFAVYRSRSTLRFVYFHMAIAMLLVYTYAVGGEMGCLLAFLVLIPIQGEILRCASIHKLNPMLLQDELTGAYNRGYMKRKATEWLHHQKPFALLFMDLDGFKAINDTYGHVVGDEILIHFVEEMRKDLRKADRVIRFGGDEFCILFQNVDDARIVQERWKGEALRFVSADDSIISYTFSSGVIEYHEDEEWTFSELLDRVDRQMYKEKRDKGKVECAEIS